MRKRYRKFTTHNTISICRFVFQRNTVHHTLWDISTVGRDKKQIQEYIRHQLEEDKIANQISLKEFIDPFTGSKNTKA